MSTMSNERTGQARSKVAGARRLLGEIFIHQLSEVDCDRVRRMQRELMDFEDELSMRYVDKEVD